jgi:predicted AAA+ superfamily ATPase
MEYSQKKFFALRETIVMIKSNLKRQLKLDSDESFFLFGARGTGKSTLLKVAFVHQPKLWIDLLDPNTEEEYQLNPMLLEERALDFPRNTWIVIDEVQKCPKLLDVVHRLIENRGLRFALTGSSSRKLKRGGANLLAGRAFNFTLFPLTYLELGHHFDVDFILSWGSLPKIFKFKSDLERNRYLKAYTQVYLKEEIVAEQAVRNLTPFRLFLQVAAQSNGEITNYANIARDTGVDIKTVQNYYQILVDTYVGFFLESYHRSVRKVQISSPKFYFLDTGVVRALKKQLNVPLQRKTTDYGSAFESWFVNECYRLNSYYELDYTFSYLKTKDDVEIDLIIERPGKKIILVEIKSSDKVDHSKIRNLLHFEKDFPDALFICASHVKLKQKIGCVTVLPWEKALELIF